MQPASETVASKHHHADSPETPLTSRVPDSIAQVDMPITRPDVINPGLLTVGQFYGHNANSTCPSHLGITGGVDQADTGMEAHRPVGRLVTLVSSGA
jgi:hypothetical protein